MFIEMKTSSDMYGLPILNWKLGPDQDVSSKEREMKIPSNTWCASRRFYALPVKGPKLNSTSFELLCPPTYARRDKTWRKLRPFYGKVSRMWLAEAQRLPMRRLKSIHKS